MSFLLDDMPALDRGRARTRTTMRRMNEYDYMILFSRVSESDVEYSSYLAASASKKSRSSRSPLAGACAPEAWAPQGEGVNGFCC